MGISEKVATLEEIISKLLEEHERMMKAIERLADEIYGGSPNVFGSDTLFTSQKKKVGKKEAR